MKKMIMTLLCLSAACANAFALQLKGRVLDPERHPVEFANVSAFTGDSIAGGCVTDSVGRFSLEVPDDCNRIRVSCIGYADTELSPAHDDLGDITLQPEVSVLKEVVVKAPLIRREADRIILNVAANPLTANKDAQELLRTAPGVWATENSLSIYGQGGTSVYIDDRKVNLSGSQLMAFLRSLQSSSIASIEIIPKGGAEYSASSSGGVIRINIKRNRIDGLSGSAGISTTAGRQKAWINPFANLSIRTGKWIFNLSGNFNASPSDKYSTNEVSENANIGTLLSGTTRHKTKTAQGNAMLGVFYEPSDRDRIGLQVDYNPDTNRSEATSQTLAASDAGEAATSGSYLSRYRFHNVNVTLNYSHLLDDKGSVVKWNSNYNYQYSATHERNRMQWLPVGNDSVYRTDNLNRYNILDSELSIQKNFKPGWKLNAGLKYTHNAASFESRHFNFLNGEWLSNIPHDYETRYREDIAAAYAALNLQSGRWKFKAGLRAEYYHTSGIEARQSRFDLFPNANIAYNLTEQGDYTVALGYYRNIRRPSFRSLNPSVMQVSDYSYSVGNPGLRPSYADALSLDFVLAGRFTVAAGYSQTSDPIRQMFVSHPDHPERMYLTWENMGKDRSGFLHADGSVRITRWWNLYASLTYVVTSQKLDDNAPYDTFGYLQAVASATFTLPHSFSVTINGFYRTRTKTGNITIYPVVNIAPTIQKRFGKQWALSLGAENLLQRTARLRAASSVYDRLTRTKQLMAARLGVTYSFTAGKGFRAPRIEKTGDATRLQKE